MRAMRAMRGSMINLVMTAKYFGKTIIGNSALDKKLLELCRHSDCSPVKIAHLLRVDGADPNAIAVRYKPFTNAPRNGSIPLALVCEHAWSSEAYYLAANLLIAGAYANASPLHGWTPLHHAAGDGSVKLIQLLVEHGANPHAKTPSGQTALHIACQSANAPVAEYLLNQGSLPDLPDKDGKTPLYCAVSGLAQYCRIKQRDGLPIIASLLVHGARPTQRIGKDAWTSDTPIDVARRGANADIEPDYVLVEFNGGLIQVDAK